MKLEKLNRLIDERKPEYYPTIEESKGKLLCLHDYGFYLVPTGYAIWTIPDQEAKWEEAGIQYCKKCSRTHFQNRNIITSQYQPLQPFELDLLREGIIKLRVRK